VGGGLFGGTVGCNYQIANVVLGIEDDLAWTNGRGSARDIHPSTSERRIRSKKIGWTRCAAASA
jgi:hypothetical protein